MDRDARREARERLQRRLRMGDALRQLHDEDPEIFRERIRAFLGLTTLPTAGRAEDMGRPPRSGPRKVTREALANLLASYESAQAREGAERWYERAEHEGFTFTAYDGALAVWDNEETLRTHLKAARKLADKDPEFRDEVAFIRWALDAIA